MYVNIIDYITNPEISGQDRFIEYLKFRYRKIDPLVEDIVREMEPEWIDIFNFAPWLGSEYLMSLFHPLTYNLDHLKTVFDAIKRLSQYTIDLISVQLSKLCNIYEGQKLPYTEVENYIGLYRSINSEDTWTWIPIPIDINLLFPVTTGDDNKVMFYYIDHSGDVKKHNLKVEEEIVGFENRYRNFQSHYGR